MQECVKQVRHNTARWAEYAVGGIGLGCLLLGAMMSLKNHAVWGDGFLILGMISYGILHLFWYGRRENLSTDFTITMTGWMLFFCIFWDAAILSKLTVHAYWKIITAAAVVLHGSLLFWIWVLAKKKDKPRMIWKNRIPYLCILLVFYALSLEVLGDWFRWDSSCYLTYMKNALDFDFTFRSVENLDLVGHLSLGFSVPTMALIYLTGSAELGCRLFNFIFGGWAILCFAGILKSILPKEKEGIRVLGTAVFAFSPWVMGMIGEVSLDYACMCFLVCMIYYDCRKNRIAEFLFAFLLCFSKEPGVILCGFYALGTYIRQLCIRQEKNLIVRGWKSIWTEEVTPFLFPCIAWVGIYLCSTRWGAGDNFHYFGFAAKYMVKKLQAMLFINFNWIFVGIILICGICLFIGQMGKKDKKVQKIHPVICPLMVSCGGFILFSLGFVTYNHARYILPLFFFYSLFSQILLSAACKKNTLKKLLLGGLAVLMMIQAFVNIDIVTARYSGLKTVDMGNTEVISTNWIASPDDVGDPIVYNRQYAYLDRTLRLALSEMPLSDGAVIVLPTSYIGVDSYGYAYDYVYYNVLGNYQYGKHSMYWNKEEGLLSSDWSEGAVEISFATLSEEDMANFTEEDQLFLMELPWIAGYEKYLGEWEKSEGNQVSYRGVEMTWYHLKQAKQG